MNDELKAKYARIANDPSQLEMFKNDVIDGKVAPAGVKLSGNSLVIPEQPGPEPVFVDPETGISYFHKYEFDLEKDFIDPENPEYGTVIFTALGEPIESEYGEEAHAKAMICGLADPNDGFQVFLRLDCYAQDTNDEFCIYSSDPTDIPMDFTSRPFTCVNTGEDVVNKTKIHLPTCSAYYGFLSADGKTFISYYNLKSDGTPEYVDSIKQGNAVLPIHAEQATYDSEGNLIVKVSANDLGRLINTPDATVYCEVDDGHFNIELNNIFADWGGDESDTIDNTNVETRLLMYFKVESLGERGMFTLIRKNNDVFTKPVNIHLYDTDDLRHYLKDLTGDQVEDGYNVTFLIPGIFLGEYSQAGGHDFGEFCAAPDFPFSMGVELMLSTDSIKKTNLISIGSYTSTYKDI